MPDMTLDLVASLVPSLKGMGVDEVHITGGEPLLNRQIFEIIALLRSSDFKVRIQSNGMYLNRERAQKLKDAGLNQVLISVDGLKNSHNIFRKDGRSFDAAIEAVKTCLDLQIFTRVNTVLYKDNLDDIEGLLDLTSEIGVDQHSFFYLAPIGRGKNLMHKILTLPEWKKVYEKILAYAKEIDFLHKIKAQDVYHGDDVITDGYDICRKDNCLIMANGDVYSCVFFVGSQYKMGNIHERSLLDIWKDPWIWNTLSAPRKKRCASKFCGAGCPGMSYLMTGSIDTCDPRCRPEQNLISSCIRQYIESK
jgi:radical SAM protein with 4Fe4S-binding SPASM domain